MKKISIETEYIKLDQLLKLIGIAQTGGQAKMIIKEGIVRVNNEVAYERGKKIRKDDVIEVEGYGLYKII
ncbi:MAG: RNA-binding S4 domain-containing protein [Tissierellia bacterium]|nr:RNA-binding S4 domain-containing protein [Tissierellia bacterium]